MYRGDGVAGDDHHECGVLQDLDRCIPVDGCGSDPRELRQADVARWLASPRVNSAALNRAEIAFVIWTDSATTPGACLFPAELLWFDGWQEERISGAED